LQTLLIWSSVPPLLPPLTVTVADVFGSRFLAAAEEVCLRCCAALFRDVLGGQEPACHKCEAKSYISSFVCDHCGTRNEPRTECHTWAPEMDRA
jgi:hypothetical protein